MPRRIEQLLLDGPAGKLEALLEEPDDREPAAAALVCHPHPQHGGTMHNKVVYRIARGLRRTGSVVLRFNYRGVNRSQGTYDNGVGETEDARSALEFLRARYPHLPYSLAGFSFGSRIALSLGCEMPSPRQIVAVGFPSRYMGDAVLAQCRAPRVFIHSTRDEFGPMADMEAYYDSLSGPKELLWVEAQDHFFAGSLDQFEEAVVKAST